MLLYGIENMKCFIEDKIKTIKIKMGKLLFIPEYVDQKEILTIVIKKEFNQRQSNRDIIRFLIS